MELLKLVYLFCGDHAFMAGARFLEAPVPRRPLPGYVVGKVVQPRRVVGLSHICRCHVAPPWPPFTGCLPSASHTESRRMSLASSGKTVASRCVAGDSPRRAGSARRR